MAQRRDTVPRFGDSWQEERDEETVARIHERCRQPVTVEGSTSISWPELDAYLRWGKRQELRRSGLSAS